MHDDTVAHQLELEILQGLHGELAGRAKVRHQDRHNTVGVS